MNGDGVKCTIASKTNTTKQRGGDSTSKLPEPKRKDDIFMERCIGEIRKNSKSLMKNLKANDVINMTLLISMQQTLQNLVDKF